MTSIPDYTTWTDKEIAFAYHNMNRKRFADHFEALNREIERRGLDVTAPSLIPVPRPTAAPQGPEFPFSWRRFIAMGIDTFVLYLVAVAFFPLTFLVEKMGVWGSLPFCLLSLIYFAIGARSGQTVGQKALNIKLVRSSGLPLDWAQVAAFALFAGDFYFEDHLPNALIGTWPIWLLQGGLFIAPYLFSSAKA